LEVIKDLDLTIPRGDRIAFVGRNGEGKSTLAKIIAGVLSYEGEFRLGHQVQVGYYAQNQHDMLDMDKTVFQTLDDVAIGDIRLRLKAILGSFMFSGEAVDKKVKVLSGGEKARLSLAKMLLKPTNLLILDEPTNHLDMQSKDILKSALLQFEGTLIIVSHDRDFLQGLTTHVFEFRKPVIKSYIGDIYDFLKAREWVQLKDIEQRESSNAFSKPDAEVSTNKQNWDRKKQMEKDKRRIEKEIEKIESEINLIEENIAVCDNQLADPEKHTEGLFTTSWYSDYNVQKQKLTQLMQQWEEKHAQLEVADAEIKAFLNE
jgi:ATP-binding cassette subfamily F protein 3